MLRAALGTLGAGSRAFSYLLGLAMLGLAAAVYGLNLPVEGVIGRALDLFGLTFIALLGALVLTTLFALAKARSSERPGYWLTLGAHSASFVATLALTYTLLGISLGIGDLSGRELNPETIQGVIGELTAHFSRAFMTTVLGLPIAALLRAVVALAVAERTVNEGT